MTCWEAPAPESGSGRGRTGFTLPWQLDDHLLTARIAIEWSREAANVAFDWAGSYRDWYWQPGAREPEFEHPYLDRIDVAVEGWEVEDLGDGLRHTMDIAWPERAPATLQFRSSDDACNGEPLLVCDRAACELRPS